MDRVSPMSQRNIVNKTLNPLKVACEKAIYLGIVIWKGKKKEAHAST